MSACTLKVNGDIYFVPCDKVDDIVYIDDYLVNIGSSTIYLYSSFIEPSNYQSGYPRIQISSLTKAVYRQSYNSSSSSSAMTVSSYEVVNRSTSSNFLLMIVILGVLVCQLFKR